MPELFYKKRVIYSTMLALFAFESQQRCKVTLS